MATISASPEMVRGSLPWGRTRGGGAGFPQPETRLGPVPAVVGEQTAPGIETVQWRIVAAIVAAFVATLVLSGPLAQGATSVAARVPAAAPAAPPESTAHRAHAVVAGDTLWTIAERWAPDADPRATVEAIRVLNGLSPQHQLQAGEVLMLPDGR
ncbi:MAG: LysM domain-containing protein [Candidatus Nanopelagicales bacterium]